ncbi:MAG: protein jag [Oscillospiraceae bacterium]|nr:protein jag [Oscillospiraceae bacterium]
MRKEFSAATLEAAKQMAADTFGVPVSEIAFTVLEEPKTGLFGGLFGKKSTEYKVCAEYTPTESVESVVAEVVEKVEKVEEEIPETIEIPQTARPTAAAEEAPAETFESFDDAPKSEVDPVVGLEKMQLGAEYLEKVMAAMYPDVKVEAQLGENGVEIELVGEDAGKLIGRRGETLDALQYLTSMVANRGDRDYLRIAIDTCGYREKRQKALQELAQRICKSVLRTGRSVALEPMNPYERRIIHSTVTAIEGVSSHSSGEEPNRKVIITSDHPQAAKNERRGGKGGYRDHGDRNDRGNRGHRNDRERKPSDGPRKLDLSTSFEKDYKRPKPEDSLNAGVYGKIEID